MMAEEDPISPSASPKVEDSMEIDLDVKEDQEAGEDEEANDAAPRAAKSGEPVTNQQYKALKEITEKLTNHKITRRGDEYAVFNMRKSPETN
jgi:hypothetical protein